MFMKLDNGKVRLTRNLLFPLSIMYVSCDLVVVLRLYKCGAKAQVCRQPLYH